MKHVAGYALKSFGFFLAPIFVGLLVATWKGWDTLAANPRLLAAWGALLVFFFVLPLFLARAGRAGDGPRAPRGGATRVANGRGRADRRRRGASPGSVVARPRRLAGGNAVGPDGNPHRLQPGGPVSIWVGRETRLAVQGLTGREGTFHALACRDYGTQVVAGVTPGKGGTIHEGIPVFDTVAQAVEADRGQRLDDLRPAAFRGRRDRRGRGGGRRRGRVHHRGDSDERHDPGEGVPRGAGRRGDGGAPDRAELPRGDHSRRVQDRNHAGADPPSRHDRRRLAVRER